MGVASVLAKSREFLHSSRMPSCDIVTDSAALQALCLTLSGSSAIALDTEFLRESTYRAELCLLQIAAGGVICAVDPLTLPSLQPLAQIMGHAGITKVLHAGRQDFEVLADVAPVLGPVFDTQIAAALCGFPAQIGYADLVQQLLGVTLAKSATRTDWSRRPLSAVQLDYALDDVRYLLPLRDLLLARIDKLGRRAWLDEDLALATDPARLAIDPEKIWRRVRGLGELDPARLRLARALGAWREQRAIARNRPRGWILHDDAVRDIVHQVPRNGTQLAALSSIPQGVASACGNELLALVRAAEVSDPPPPLPRRARPDPAFTAQVQRLSAIIQAHARELELAPEILATRRDLEDLARGDDQALRGWRRALLAADCHATIGTGPTGAIAAALQSAPAPTPDAA